MRRKGFSEDVIEAITVGNPARILRFRIEPAVLAAAQIDAQVAWVAVWIRQVKYLLHSDEPVVSEGVLN